MEDRIDRLERAERELERVEAQRERLREALEIAVNDGSAGYLEWIEVAKDALAETEEDGE